MSMFKQTRTVVSNKPKYDIQYSRFPKFQCQLFQNKVNCDGSVGNWTKQRKENDLFRSNKFTFPRRHKPGATLSTWNNILKNQISSLFFGA